MQMWNKKDKETNVRHRMLALRNGEKNPEKSKMCLFYILAADKILYEKASEIYDFATHKPKIECLKTIDLDISRKIMLEVGFNICGSYKSERIDPLNLITYLDRDKLFLCQQVILGYKES